MTDLIARLESAEGPSRELDFLIAIAVDWRWPDWEEGEPTIKRQTEKHGLDWALSSDRRQSIWRDIPRFSSSVDAALTLVPEGWSVGLGDLRGYQPIVWRAHLRDHNDPSASTRAWVEGHASTPALALCIAALRAKGVE